MLTSRISGCKGSANHENKQIYLNNSQMPTALKATKQTKQSQRQSKCYVAVIIIDFNRCNAAFTAQSTLTEAQLLSPRKVAHDSLSPQLCRQVVGPTGVTHRIAYKYAVAHIMRYTDTLTWVPLVINHHCIGRHTIFWPRVRSACGLTSRPVGKA